jgi:hypothetical protein
MRKFLAAPAAALACLLAVVACGGAAPKAKPKPVQPAGQHVYQTPWGPEAHSLTFGLPPKGLRLPRPRTGITTFEQYDAIYVSSLAPLGNPVALAGYTAGFWPDYLPLVQAYPKAIVKSIAIGQQYHAQCLDVEPGDAVPSQVAGWIKAVLNDPGMHMKPGTLAIPCVYSSLNEWSQITPLLNAAGLVYGRDYLRWDADWTYSPHLDQGFDATQWTDHYANLNVDASVVTKGFLGINTPTPKPQPAPLSQWQQGYNAGYLAVWCREPGHSAICKTTVKR